MKSTMKSSENMSKPKKSYTSPVLSKFGNVCDLTAGGSGTLIETMPGMGMNLGMNLMRRP